MILNDFQLTGKVAMVTGCSTGLGQGMALGLAEAGADIVSVDYVDAPETKEAVEKLGRQFLGLKADLTTIEPVEDLVKSAAKEFGHLDILVNNAGIIRREDAIKFSEKDWDDVMNINVKTVFFLSQAAARQFIAQGQGGKIINVASMLLFSRRNQGSQLHRQQERSDGHHPSHGQRMGCRSYQKTVNAVAPGYMATNNTAPLRADKKRSAELLERIPAGRWGLPDDLKGPVVFLASSASDYVTGYTIAVDGGWLAR
jgi:2-deoxy-D-gluconate 3-dehydrogenase